jgi:hypothetical protein
MSTRKSVRLFLADGTPGGLLTVEIMNWTGHLVTAPRSDLGSLLKRPEPARTGVYILIGDDPDAVAGTRARRRSRTRLLRRTAPGDGLHLRRSRNAGVATRTGRPRGSGEPRPSGADASAAETLRVPPGRQWSSPEPGACPMGETSAALGSRSPHRPDRRLDLRTAPAPQRSTLDGDLRDHDPGQALEGAQDHCRLREHGLITSESGSGRTTSENRLEEVSHRTMCGNGCAYDAMVE